MKNILWALLCLLINFTVSGQETWDGTRADAHAPIGVMGDHTHNKGEFMVSYRFMRMGMDGMRDGTSSLSNEAVLATYMVTPITMPMSMHMIGTMYALSDRLTLMAMFNFLNSEMEHLTRMGGSFVTQSGGFGDMQVAGLYKLLDNGKNRLHLNLGVRIPTGSITEQDITPASEPNETQLPYPMQVGTGSWHVIPGMTFVHQGGYGSFGAQLVGNFLLNENDRDYRWGNSGKLTAWYSYLFADWISASVRATGMTAGSIRGADPAYNMALMNNMVPTVDPDNFGGERIDLGFGLNFYIPNLKGLRLAD